MCLGARRATHKVLVATRPAPDLSSIMGAHTVMLNRIRSSPFARNVATLSSGLIVAQAIGILASPLLTRLYTPENYAAVALFLAIVSAIMPGACGKYEVGIVVAKTEHDATQLFGLSILLSAAISGVLFLAITVFYDQVTILFNSGNLGVWLLLAPLGLLMSSAISAFGYLANRSRDYGFIARSALVQVVGITTINITLGLLGTGTNGMMLANLLSMLLGVGFAMRHFRGKINREALGWSDCKRLVAHKYRDFPIYNGTTSLLNGITLALPVFFLTKYYPATVVGAYALLLRVAQTPLAVLSNAVTQVHLRTAVDLVHTGKDVTHHLHRLTLVLVSIVVVPSVVLAIVSPSLFAWVFGEDWRLAGELLPILMPAIALKFVVSSVSSVCGATGNNLPGAIWKVTSCVATFAMFFYYGPILDVREMFIAMAVTDCVLYTFFYGIIWYSARTPKVYS